MAGPIQKAFSEAVSTASALAVLGKKMHDNERQISKDASAEAEAKEKAESASKQAEEAYNQEAKDTALEADLVRMGASPESANAFMTARSLGLSTKGFGMLRQKGRYIGSYSTIAQRLSQDSLADSLSSRVINQEGFAKRVMDLGGTRKGRVEALVKASGGKK